MQQCNLVPTPLEKNQRFMASTDTEPIVNSALYQQVIRSIMYLATATFPDLAYTSTNLSHYNVNPSETHMKAAKWALKSLKGTKDLKLKFMWKSPLLLNGYSDV